MRKVIVILFAVALLFAISGGAWAEQQAGEKGYYHGVEYSDDPDDQAEASGGAHDGADPGQVIFTVVIDEAGAPLPMNSSIDYNYNDYQVDALANHSDLYFWWMEGNRADLLVSFDCDPVAGDTAVWWESRDGERRWRMWQHYHLSNMGDKVGDPNLSDLDGLELYYSNNEAMEDDADMCSFVFDALTTQGGTAFSVWEYNNDNPTGWIPQADIVTAVRALGWIGTDANVDVDALMVDKPEQQGDEAATIIFSIKETGNWHGGELVVMPVSNPGGAWFLNHGGHPWDNEPANEPKVLFAVDDNEIDAIEALGPAEKEPPKPPEDWEPCKLPALTNWGLLILLVLLILSGIYVIYQRRRGVVRA
jgi:hypothetical protein